MKLQPVTQPPIPQDNRYMKEYAKRQKDYARRFLAGTPFDAIVKEKGQTKTHIAQEICFGAFCLREQDPQAAKLSDLATTDGIGNIGAINRYERMRKDNAN
jgi:hypothetical protein